MDRMSTPVSLLAASALLLSGCATTTVEPRAFSPVVQPPPPDMAAFEREFSDCASQASANVAVFYRSHPELKPVKEGDVDFTPTGGGAIGPGDMGSGGIALIALIIAAFQAGGRSHARQAHQQATEQDIQTAITACLKARGHTVIAWRLVQDGQASGARLQTPTQPTGRAYLMHEAQDHERLAESDPKSRATSLRMAADIYNHLAEGANDGQEKARLFAKAAEVRRKADEPGPASRIVRIAPYAATPGASVLAEVPQRTFVVEAARDARPGVHPASEIGDFGGPNGEFDTVPPPGRLIQDVFSAELSAAGHRPASDNPDFRIIPEMRRFDVWAEGDGSKFHSDVKAGVDITVSFEAPRQPARSRDYSANCTRQATFTIGQGLLAPLVADCLKQIGAQFRQDVAVRDFLNATRSK